MDLAVNTWVSPPFCSCVYSDGGLPALSTFHVHPLSPTERNTVELALSKLGRVLPKAGFTI